MPIRDRIALNVNADESAVLGAALYGASLSRQFKTKDIRVTDVIMHDVQASYLTSNAPTRTIHTAVLPRGSKHGAKKTLTFKRQEDFSVVLNYPNEVMSCVFLHIHIHISVELRPAASPMRSLRRRLLAYPKQSVTSLNAAQSIR